MLHNITDAPISRNSKGRTTRSVFVSNKGDKRNSCKRRKKKKRMKSSVIYILFCGIFLFGTFLSHGEEKVSGKKEEENVVEQNKEIVLAIARSQAIFKFLLVDMLPKTESHPLYLEGSEYSVSGDVGQFNARDSIGIVHCNPKSENTTYIGVRKYKAYLIIVDYPGEYFSYFDRKHTNWSVGSILEGQLEDVIEHSIPRTSGGVSCNDKLSVYWWKRGVDASILKSPEQFSTLVAKYLLFLNERERTPFQRRVECDLSPKLYETLIRLFETLRIRENNNPKIPDVGSDVFLENMKLLEGVYREMEFYELIRNGKSFCFTLGYRDYDENSLPFYIDMLCNSLSIYIKYSNNGVIKCTAECCMFCITREINEIFKNRIY